MPDLRELLRRRSSDFLRRAFRRDERWKARLQRLGAEPKLVVIRIRNFRLVFPIIEAVVALDLPDQEIMLVLRLFKRENSSTGCAAPSACAASGSGGLILGSDKAPGGGSRLLRNLFARKHTGDFFRGDRKCPAPRRGFRGRRQPRRRRARFYKA